MRKIFVLLILMMTGCQSVQQVATFIKPTKVWLTKISLTAEEDANNGIPIVFHLVFIYDDGLLKMLSEKSSAQYFEEIEKIKADFSGKMSIFSYDIIKGRSKNDIELKPEHYSIKGALAFARYTGTEANQRKAIGEQKEVRFVFKKDTFNIIDVES